MLIEVKLTLLKMLGNIFTYLQKTGEQGRPNSAGGDNTKTLCWFMDTRRRSRRLLMTRLPRDIQL